MFTHHHVDHNADFISLLVRTVVSKDPIAIYGPSRTTILTDLFLDYYEEDLNYRLGKGGRTLDDRKDDINVRDLKSGDTFSIGDIKVSTLEVPHTIETLAYRFDYQDQSIVVTGDLTYTDKLAAFAKGANCMIIDSGGTKMVTGTELTKKKRKTNDTTNSTNEPLQAHLDINDSSKMAGQANVDTMVYTHFLPGTIDETATLNIVRKNYTGKVIFSTDLMQLNCGN